MTTRPGVTVACCSVAIVALVNATAAALGPDEARRMLLLCSIVALGIAGHSAAWNPAGFPAALYLSLPPVIALLADDSSTWLIGPLGALLLVAGELHALSWECRGTSPIDAMARRRLLNIGQLGALGLMASLAVALVASGASPGGTAAVVVAALALAALAHITFRRGT